MMLVPLAKLWGCFGMAVDEDSGAGVSEDAKNVDRRPFDVSVIIPYFRAHATIAAQLDALVLQNTVLRFEVLVADNEGCEQLRSIVDPYTPRLNIRVVAAHKKRGPSHPRNVAVGASSARFVLFCDADDVVTEHWLQELCDVLNGTDALVTGPMRLDRINAPRTWPRHSRDDVETTSQPTQNAPILVRPFATLDYLPFASAANLGLRRQTYISLGGMNERLVDGSEDEEFSWRAQEAGYPLISVDAAVVDYRLRAESRAVFHQQRRYARGQLRLWAISRDVGRPVRGMSLRWAIKKAVRLPFEYRRARNEGMAERYAFAHRAGAIVGNLQGQAVERILRPRLIRDRLRPARGVSFRGAGAGAGSAATDGSSQSGL